MSCCLPMETAVPGSGFETQLVALQNLFPYHPVSILVRHGSSSSKMGDIKEKDLEVFISTPKWSFPLLVINLHILLVQTTLNCKAQLAAPSDGRCQCTTYLSVGVLHTHTESAPLPGPARDREEPGALQTPTPGSRWASSARTHDRTPQQNTLYC